MALNAVAALWTAKAYENLRIACMAHAALSLVCGFSIFLGIVTAKLWLLLQWSWFLWPIILSVHPERSVRGVVVPVAVGLVLLVPNVFWLYAFSAWSINGFAP